MHACVADRRPCITSARPALLCVGSPGASAAVAHQGNDRKLPATCSALPVQVHYLCEWTHRTLRAEAICASKREARADKRLTDKLRPADSARSTHGLRARVA